MDESRPLAMLEQGGRIAETEQLVFSFHVAHSLPFLLRFFN